MLEEAEPNGETAFYFIPSKAVRIPFLRRSVASWALTKE
jgi:hypothetical protein